MVMEESRGNESMENAKGEAIVVGFKYLTVLF